MLLLTRKIGEGVVIDGRITVTVLGSCGDRVRVAVTAPSAVPLPNPNARREARVTARRPR